MSDLEKVRQAEVALESWVAQLQRRSGTTEKAATEKAAADLLERTAALLERERKDAVFACEQRLRMEKVRREEASHMRVEVVQIAKVRRKEREAESYREDQAECVAVNMQAVRTQHQERYSERIGSAEARREVHLSFLGGLRPLHSRCPLGQCDYS